MSKVDFDSKKFEEKNLQLMKRKKAVSDQMINTTIMRMYLDMYKYYPKNTRSQRVTLALFV